MRRSMLKNGVNALKLKIGVRSSPTHLLYSSYTDRVKRFAKIKSSETLPLSMYENGSFILFNNSQILIRKLDGSLELSWKSYAGLWLKKSFLCCKYSGPIFYVNTLTYFQIYKNLNSTFWKMQYFLTLRNNQDMQWILL